MASFKAEVMVAGERNWATNALRFATETEAEVYGNDLASRWLLVREVRVAPSDEPVNYAIVDGVMVRVEQEVSS